jgi:oligopeptide transport system ATP-binding protein
MVEETKVADETTGAKNAPASADSGQRGSDSDIIVEVEHLKQYFPINAGMLFSRRVGDVKAVDDVSFSIRRGETLGLVGESGCGKSTTGRSILQLNTPTEGVVKFNGENIAGWGTGKMRPLRKEMQLIFQDPYSSLNPRMTCGSIIGEPLIVHSLSETKNEYRERVAHLLEVVGLNPFMADRYPHEFSGGQRQRIGIARALAVSPSFIVCDEPVSALDVSIQAQVINLLEDLQEQFDLTYLFIAHDLSVVRHISDRIAVMYLGHIVEIADRNELYVNPLHPYTQALLSAIPIPDPVIEANRERIILEGDVPSPSNPPAGCVFHTRCPIAIEDCQAGIPELQEVSPDHWVACIRADGYKN